MYEARLALIITISYYQMLPADCWVINQNVVLLPQDNGEKYNTPDTIFKLLNQTVVLLPQDHGEKEEYPALLNDSTSGGRNKIETSQWSVANDTAVLKITPALIREKILRKTRKLLKKLRFMYKDYEPEVDIAMCYVKYFEVIPGLTMSKRSADDDSSQEIRTIVRDTIASLKIIGRYLLTSLENMFSYLISPHDSLSSSGGDPSDQASNGSNLSDTVDRNAEPVTFSQVVSGSLSALYNSVFGGNVLGAGAQQWLRKSVEMFNTHKLILCTRHYIMEKMWGWVDGGTVLGEIE